MSAIHFLYRQSRHLLVPCLIVTFLFLFRFGWPHENADVVLQIGIHSNQSYGGLSHSKAGNLVVKREDNTYYGEDSFVYTLTHSGVYVCLNQVI